MSDLLTRPASTEAAAPSQSRLAALRERWPRLTSPRPPRSAWTGGCVAGLFTALASAVLCVAMVALGGTASGDSTRGAGQAGLVTWLLAHCSGVRTGTADVRAVPLGLTLLLGCWAFASARRVRVGSRWRAGSAPASVSALAGGVLGFTIAYGGVVAGLAGVASLLGSDVDAARAVAVAAALAAGASAVGLWGPRTMADRAQRTMPFALLAMLRGAAAGCLVMLIGTVVVFCAAVITSAGRFLDLTAALDLTWSGALMLFGTFLLALPNLLGLTGSVLLGPGFALGTGTKVTATSVTLGAVPSWPPLAALPGSGTTPVWAVALLVVPVLAGAAAGWLGASCSVGGSWRQVCAGAGAGVLAGLVVGGWVLASGGAIGPGRMADVGAAASSVPLAVATLGAGALLGGCAQLLAARPTS
jgi:hypothetical protein